MLVGTSSPLSSEATVRQGTLNPRSLARTTDPLELRLLWQQGERGEAPPARSWIHFILRIFVSSVPLW